ncbi:hypothetical protein CNMCM8980_007377 [Aspergillus fumigatiaffinis]|nr:hypothetical protein CNMCM8980_007377 [Aspergillus fumigatiaffinis]
MQLAGAAREDGVTLSVADVFKHPKLSSLAACLDLMPHDAPGDLAPFSLVIQAGVRDEVLQLAMAQSHVSEDQVADIYPCTALQEGLMALTMKTPGAYVAHFSYTVPGTVNLDQLCAAWNAVARANPILQTRIVQSDTLGTFQVVVAADLEWAIYDSEDAFRGPTSTSFGLGDPLVRATVLQAHDICTSHRLTLSMHHAVYDAWSLPLLLGQAEAVLRGETLRLRPFSPFISYLMRSKDVAEAFWHAELTDTNAVPFPPLPAPSYVPTPSESVTHTIVLPPDVRGDFTLSTTLRLAWALTISQYTNTDDVVFGLTVTGRGAQVVGIDQMTGPTIATIPLRVRLDSDTTVAQALQQEQDHSARLLPYEQTGLQQIRRLSDDAAAACDFQNLLLIQRPCQEALTGLFRKGEVTANQAAFTTYALTLLCELEPNSVAVQATYDPHIIGEAEVQRLLCQLAHVTQAIQRHPDKRIRDVSSLSPEDRAQLQQWNGVVPTRVERCVHELIAERCRTQPDAPAVCAWDGDFTYGELDRRSSALAAHLARLGVGPEVFVPLLFEKSRWTAVAMLGVMKAGGAFVLLDPSQPQLRLQAICNAVSATFIMTSAANATAAAGCARQVVIVDDRAAWYASSRCQIVSHVASHNVLYAVFTSGSMGIPKGISIEHRSFSTRAVFYSLPLSFSSAQDCRVFQFSSYTWDVSIFDTLSTLVWGGCVCTPSENERRDDLGIAVTKYGATSAILTPSMLKVLDPSSVPTLKFVTSIGEILSGTTAERWIPRLELINSYGPTECTVLSHVLGGIPQTTANCSRSGR